MKFGNLLFDRVIKKIVSGDDKLIFKMILYNTLALCFTSFLDAMCLFVDSTVAAKWYGHNAMVALGLSSPMFNLICIFTGVITFGAQSVCTYHISKGDKKVSNAVFSDLILLSTISAIILSVMLFVNLDSICYLFGAAKEDPEVYDMLRAYLKGLIWVVPGYTGFVALSPYVILDGNRKCVWSASAVQLITSIIGDFISLYIFDAGLYGVGMATGVGYIFATIVLASNFKGDSIFHFDIKLVDFKYFTEILWIGSPRCFKYICGFLLELYINYIILIFGGKIAMAVFTAIDSISAFLYMIGYGLSESAVYATQLLYGERGRKELHRMTKIIVRLAFIITCLIMIVVIFTSRFIAELFIKDSSEVIMYIHTTIGIILLAMSVPIYTLNGIIIGYLQGARKVVHAEIITITQKFVGYIGSAYILGYFFGPIGLYASVPACELVTLITYLIMVFFYNKANKREDKLLLLPESFDENIKYSLLFGVRNNGDISKIIDEATKSLEKQGYTDRNRLHDLKLCIEGIVGNVIQRGFSADDKVHNCNVKIMLYNDNSISLGVRDDCKKFDLKKTYESINEENANSYVGLKLIYGIPKEISYNHLLGFNNTVVTI